MGNTKAEKQITKRKKPMHGYCLSGDCLQISQAMSKAENETGNLINLSQLHS